MAHLIYEYSANLSPGLFDIRQLMGVVHRAAAASGVFPEAGLRSRALRCEDCLIGDGDPSRGFVHLSLRVGRGRALETRLELGRQLFELMVSTLQPLLAAQEVALSFELRELEEHVKFNHRNY